VAANHCPICDFKSGFKNFRGRERAQCPTCGSLERHRLVWLYWREQTTLFDGQPKRMLHFAPEACFRGRLPNVPGIDYLSGDLNPGSVKAMRKLNLTRLDLPSETFQVFHCSHVLEHIPDDAAAMRELYRVLAPGGWGIIQVPLRRGEHTYVDPNARTAEQRTRAYGQYNHVRIYGELDLAPALRMAGFTVEPTQYGHDLPWQIAGKYGVDRDELLFFCYKNGHAES
jgi:SAM-dependent methyltransferase